MPRVVLASFWILTTLWATGCTPSIGDKCILSTDCSVRGDRLCDTSQPGGYCTIFNCRGNLCPDNAACILFNAAVQGCGYDDRAPSRTGRTFCMASCSSDSDCRSGYICSDPREAPWNALILDDTQTERVCIVPPDNGKVGTAAEETHADAAVCAPIGPLVSTFEAGAGDAGDSGIPDAASIGDAADGSTPDAGDGGVADAADGGVADAADGG